MMAKWPQGVENGGQKGSQNHDKIDINFDPEKIKRGSKNHENMRPTNLEKH